MSENTNNLNDNGVIPNFTPAPVFRNSVENKNLLEEKNSMYIGTGETQTVIFGGNGGIGGIKYSIPITKALTPPKEDKSVLKTDSNGENVLWGPLKVSEIKDDGTPVNVVSVESVRQALDLSPSQLNLLSQLVQIMTVSSQGVIFNGEVAANSITQLEETVTYTVENGEATITGLTPKGRKLFSNLENQGELPSAIGGYPVTSISSYAFENENSIVYMKIPSSITWIGVGVFYNCSNLTSIEVNSNNAVYHSSNNCVINTADKILVAGCKTSEIPDDGSVTSIGEGAFGYCTGLTSIVIPNTVTNIATSAFWGCSGLTSLTIPSSVTSLKEQTLFACSSLQDLTLPFIGAQAESSSSDGRQNLFGYIFGTTNYTGATAVTQSYLGTDASSSFNILYYIPSSLRNITITGGNEVAYGAFSKCSMVNSISLPDNITSIGPYAFHSCSSLTAFSLPTYITNIGEYAFASCSSLSSITIPSGVRQISNGLFGFCTNLQSVIFPAIIESIGTASFSFCSKLTSLDLPSSVSEIGGLAFAGTGLTSITIPRLTIKIDTGAFRIDTLTSAVFEETLGWEVSRDKDFTSPIELSSGELSNPTTAASYLAGGRYTLFYWRRNS